MKGSESMLTSTEFPVKAPSRTAAATTTATTVAPTKSIITEVETKIEGARVTSNKIEIVNLKNSSCSSNNKVVNTKRVAALLNDNNLSSDLMASMVLMASNDGLNRNIGSTLLTLRNVSGYANNLNNNYSVKNNYNNNNSNNNCHNDCSNCSNEDCNNNTNNNNNYNDNSQKSICSNSNSSSMSENHKTDQNNKSNNNNNNNSNLPEPGPGPPGEHNILSTNVRNALASISTNSNPYVTDVFVMTNGNNFLVNNNNSNNNNNNNFQNSRYQSKTAILQALQQCHLQQQQQDTTFQQITNLQDQQNTEHLMPTAQLLHAFNQPQQQQQQPHQRQNNSNSNNNNNINSDSSSNTDHISAHGMQCGFCCQTISDRYIMRVMDTYFHEACLKCANCSLNLVHSCFTRDGKLYCRIDYERLFLRNRCLGCGRNIASDELVMRTLENVFHLKCFACVVCGTVLKKGEQYVVRQGQLFCRFDYEKEVEMLQGYDYYGDDLFPPKLDGRRGPKRPRTILNTQQRRAFKASFELSPKPCRKVRENLAKDTGLSLRIVQVWFQNQRAKVKKIQKKAKVEPAKSVADSQDSLESDSSLAKIKDEAHSDNESLLESPFSVCGTISNSSETVNKLTCMKEEHDNMPFNCMETNKENCNKTNEPILNTILGLSYATFQQLGTYTPTPMINPIDRLYSMQNSYFRPEELGFGDCDKNGNNL